MQPNFEVLAYLDRLSTDALGALACASVTRIDAHTAQLHIDRTSVGRALALGDDVEILVERLRLHAGTVPDNVATTMRDWAARRDRLRVHVDARVLEYANEAERDDALSRLRGARALAERFVLLDPDAPIPATGHAHHYLDPPHPSLTFGHDSAVRIKGDVDLPGRAALHALTTPHRNGQRRIAPEAVRASTRPGEHMEALVARARNQLPPQLHAMMRAWSGASPRPVVATASLFRHPDASAWAEHPDVGPLLGAQIAPTTFLVRPEQQEALRAQLEALGVTPTTALDREPEAPPSAEDGALQTGLSTRKKRELIEAALEAGHELELRYTEERERYDRYGRVRRSKGKARTEVVTPDAVEYAGSIPYLLASASPRGTERIIRIGYIDAIAMRSEGSPAG